MLKQINAALEHADFVSNRRFMSWALPSFGGTVPPIRPEYIEEIENWWGDIPSEFNRMRERAMSALWNLEEAAELLNDIITTDDPEIALSKAQELYYSFGRVVPIPDDLWSDDFVTVVKEHKIRYDHLSSAGLLGAYAVARQEVTQRIVSDLESEMPLPRDVVYVLHVHYDQGTLRKLAFRSELNSGNGLVLPKSPFASLGERDPLPFGLLSSKSGHIVAYLVPGRISYDSWRNGRMEPDVRPWAEKLVNVATSTTRYILEQMLVHRFDLEGED